MKSQIYHCAFMDTMLEYQISSIKDADTMYVVDDKYINETISNSVTTRLRQDIINGRFEIGERITIKQIAEDYNVSPMPVREAFNCLKGEKLLVLEQYKGATIKPLDKKSVSDIYDVRESIEELIMVNIAQKGVEDSLCKRLHEINESIGFSINTETISQRFAEVNDIFHTTLFKMCDNQYAKDIYQIYTNLLRALKKRYPVNIERIHSSYIEHNRIIDAVSNQRIEDIRCLARDHANGAKEEMLANMGLEK